MTKLLTFWKTHRLGMFYGFLWFFVVGAVYASIGYLPATDHLVATLLSCLATGIIVTAVMRKKLTEKKSLLWQTILSQALGAFLLGILLGIFGFSAMLWSLIDAKMHGVAGKPIGMEKVAEFLLMGPFFVLYSFISIFTPIFLPLAWLNTWHLRKLVHQSSALPQAASQP